MGVITTVPITVTGEELIVNADPTVDGRNGAVEVAAVDQSGHALQGYVRETSTTIESDDLRHRVTWDNASVDHWNEGATLDPLWGRALRFRLYLDNADLYTMSFR